MPCKRAPSCATGPHGKLAKVVGFADFDFKQFVIENFPRFALNSWVQVHFRERVQHVLPVLIAFDQIHFHCVSGFDRRDLIGASEDLSSRLGIGYRNAFPFSLPAIAMHYHPGSGLSMFAAIGVDTQEYNSKFGLQLGLRKIVFKEDHLNFFMGGTFSTLTQEVQTGATTSNKNSGYELAAVVGAEFFFGGLDNLGFNIETGVAVTSLDKVRFRTLGEDLLRAGITFYF